MTSKLYRAIGRSMAARYASYAASLISLMILTRLFAPDVFGVVAAAQTIIILFQMVAEGGLTPAIINQNHLPHRDRDGIFGLSLVTAIVLAVVALASSPAIAGFYGMPEIEHILPYVAIALLANTAAVMPLALLQRQQSFFRISQAGIVSEILAVSVAYAASFHLQNLHAYALYFPCKALVNFVGVWRLSGGTEFGRPMPGMEFKAIRPLLRTTGYQLAFNFVNYFSRNLDNILVGRLLGAAPLGIYDRSYQIMRYPLQLLTFAMTPAIQPVLRGATHDRAAVRALHGALAFKLSLLGSAAAILVFALARPIVLVLLGENWADVVPVIRLLALIIPVQIILSTSGSFFQAFGRTDLLFRCGLFSAALNSTGMVIALSHGGLETLCWSLFITFHASFLQAYFVMHRQLFGGGYLRFLANVSPIALTTGLLSLIALTAHA